MESTTHKEKTALVTGAGGGLGRAIAEEFLAKGANVVICDVNKDLLADFTEKVSAAYPNRTLVLECDVTSDAGLDDMFHQAESVFGHLDYVVNSAGIMDRFDPAGDLERKAWDRLIAINLTAPAMITKRAVNLFLKKGTKGAIVNVSSVAGFRGFANGAAYTASKHGLLGLTKNTAAFYGPKGIRCNAIMPGAMATNVAATALRDGFNMEGLGLMRRTFPEGSTIMCDVPKVARLVLYLCSEDADMVNGACWTVDAGATAN